MKHKLLIISFLITNIWGCSAQSQPSWEHLRNPEVLKLIDDYPLTHDKISNAEIKALTSPFGMLSEQYCGVFLGYQYDKEEFQMISDEIKISHQKLISLENLRRMPGDENVCDFDFVIPGSSKTFLQYQDFMTEDPEYYIYKNKEGRFVPDNYLDYETICQDQKHGYSSGAAIDTSTRRIMHWMMVW